MTNGTPFALVIFDCDGVLVDSEPATNRVIAEELTKAGWPTTTDEALSRFVGGTLKSIEDQLRDRNPALRADWLDATYTLIFDALKNVEKIAGIDDVLDALDAAKIPYCIGSNGPHRKMDVTLGGTGLNTRFEGRIYSGYDFSAGKPAPDMFLHAAEAFGVDPAATAVIGDSRNDALAARAAGMRCFGYCADASAEMFVEHGATPFNDMRDLPGLLLAP